MPEDGTQTGDWYTAEEARRVLGYNALWPITKMCQDGVLQAIKRGRRWSILKSSVHRHLEKRKLAATPCPSCGGTVTYRERTDGRWHCPTCDWDETGRGLILKRQLEKILEGPDEELRDGIKKVIGFTPTGESNGDTDLAAPGE